MKEDMSLSNLGTVALHAAKVHTNVFSSTLICILPLELHEMALILEYDIIVFITCSPLSQFCAATEKPGAHKKFVQICR